MGVIQYGWSDPDILYSFLDSTQRNGGLNFINTTDPTLDRLLVAGRTTLNQKKARADYYQIQKIFDTKVYGDPLWVPVVADAVRNRVQGWHVTKSYGIQYLDFWIK
jgi:ABC-type transport system substrate-binding protein